MDTPTVGEYERKNDRFWVWCGDCWRSEADAKSRGIIRTFPTEREAKREKRTASEATK